MTTIETTALAALDKEGRLLNAVAKGPTNKPGYFGFRGDIALKFQVALADEKRPPEYSLEQVLTVVKGDDFRQSTDRRQHGVQHGLAIGEMHSAQVETV